VSKPKGTVLVAARVEYFKVAVQITHIRPNENRTQFERTRMLFDFVRAAFVSPRTTRTDLSRRLRNGVSFLSWRSWVLGFLICQRVRPSDSDLLSETVYVLATPRRENGRAIWFSPEFPLVHLLGKFHKAMLHKAPLLRIGG